MLAFLFAVAVSASGDPYIQREGVSTVLSTAQDAALQTLIAARFSGVTYANIYRIDCVSEDDVKPWRCDVDTWATPTWEAIVASLLSQTTWVPGQGSTINTWLVRTSKSFTASAAWRTHAQSIWADLLASPMLRLTYTRANGTGSFVAHLNYKRSMNQAGISAAVNAGETLIPDGVTP